MQATLVKFREAKILSEAGHDIGVQCVSDGSWFSFINDLDHYGSAGIDNEYNFVWIH